MVKGEADETLSMQKFKEALTLQFMYNLESEGLLKCCVTLVLALDTAGSAPYGYLHLMGVNSFPALSNTTHSLHLIKLLVSLIYKMGYIVLKCKGFLRELKVSTCGEHLWRAFSKCYFPLPRKKDMIPASQVPM